MKMMITGGNAGLGQHLKQRFHADDYSRSTGWTIPKDCERLAKISLGYDVVINNAYDGTLGESWHAFGQVEFLHHLAMAWRAADRLGWIINVGGVGSEDQLAPAAGWETYNANKRALKHLSLQWTQAFRSGQVRFRTCLLTLDRLDTLRSRQMPSWTGNGIDLEDVAHMVDLCLAANANTCVGEIKAWVALDHKHA